MGGSFRYERTGTQFGDNMNGQIAQVIAFPSRRRGGEKWEPWVSETVVAREFSVSTRTVRRWRMAGMPSRLIGGSRRFRLSEVQDWHAKGEV